MTPEKLSQWVTKTVPGGRTLVLAHDQAVGQPLVVGTWTREDVDECVEQNKSIGAQVMDCAQDHADSVGESCRFTLQWRSDVGATLRAIIHRAQPSERPTHEGALHAEFVSPNAMIGQLLSHISQQQRVINGSIGAVLAAYERGLMMQQRTIDSQSNIIVALQNNLPARVEGTTPYEQQLIDLKTQALRKGLDLLPDVTKMIVTAVAARLAGDALEADAGDAEDDAAAPHVNGKGGEPVAGAA